MSSSSEEDCKTMKNRYCSPRLTRKTRRAATVNTEDLFYPSLNITVTQSPKCLRRVKSLTQDCQIISPKNFDTPKKVFSSCRKSATISELKNRQNFRVENATKKLDFDKTIFEEKIECRYVLNHVANQSENIALSTFKQQTLSKLSESKEASTSEKHEMDHDNQETNSKLEDDERILSKSILLNETQPYDDGNQSDELFSPQDVRCRTPLEEIAEINIAEKGGNFSLGSSLETLITPYQENQQTEEIWHSYNSQTNIFDGTYAQTSAFCASVNNSDKSEIRVSNVGSILTKADEYDILKKKIPVAGSSKCPSSFESVIQFQSSDSQKSNENMVIRKVNKEDLVEDKTFDILDLTSHLETISDNEDNSESVFICSKSQPMECVTSNTNMTFKNASLDPLKAYIRPKFKPPTHALILQTMQEYKIPQERNVSPFYSDSKHVTSAIDVGFNTLRILSRNHHSEFHSSFPSLADYQREVSAAGVPLKELRQLKLSYCGSNDMFVKPIVAPPGVRDVKLWLIKQRQKQKKLQKEGNTDDTNEINECKEVKDNETNEMLGLRVVENGENSEIKSPTLNKSSWDNSHAISGVSLNNTHGFKMTLVNLQDARSLDIYQYITSLVLELHADSRGVKLPNPQVDHVQALFFALVNDIPDQMTVQVDESGEKQEEEHFLKGFICVNSLCKDSNILQGTGITLNKHIYIVDDELGLFNKFLELFHSWNPDILIGYEIEQSSWGYLIDRGYVLGLNLPSLLSRIKDEKIKEKQGLTAENDNREEDVSHLKITGRIVLDLWRILKHEIALQSYTFENLVFHVLHERVPRYSHKELTLWWKHNHPKYRHRTVDYYFYRVEAAFRLIDHYDLIGRTAELARLFGILFYEVLSRGSQFRVESMMLRLAKPYQMLPVSPSVQQRAHMKAPEFLPLILEPESKFYKDPVIVLDFQSLYPSIIIAYNYCFSTCLGRIDHLASDTTFEFGAYELEVSRKLVGKLLRQNLLTISPCGVAFVKDQVRAGIMPRMLREILDTRLMVKKSMKTNKDNKTLHKVLHSRQLGLKLIANVTYGYTAANFSGRMPACELADSVVSKGRETLQRAINMVEQHPDWGARVVYGDTDSLFVLCEGRTRQEAFRIGDEIVEAVTNANPSPVRLKLEKVYQPCILQTKKRYVGYMYESADQKMPEFEAKGIETVRRDGCPATSKMLEKCLRLLFDNRDVSQIRNYVLKQFNKILTGRVSIQDLTFAKEYRGREGYRPGACVPALELTRKWMTVDKRKEPRSGERVPYVIVNGPPGLPLIKLVKSPHDLLEDSCLRPNALYYITKAIIPPINRCFKLIGADLFHWFNELPRKQIQHLHIASPSKGPKSTISQYFATADCASCGEQTKDGLCIKCLSNSQSTVVNLSKKIYAWERHFYMCKKICSSCTCRSTELVCNSLDCPVLYRLKQSQHDLQQTDFIRDLFELLPNSTE